MKRFCDTELSDKEWFMSLSCRLKCVVRYLFDKCDSSGVWTPNYILGATYVGEAFTEDDILKIDDGAQFEKFNEKIFVIGFCQFQYGELKETCHPHRAIIQKLKKHGLYERVLEGYCKGTVRVQEKDQDKEKDMDKDFGKSENLLNQKLLVPEMLKTFKKFNSSYPADVTKDSKPLQQIGKFICDAQKIPYNPRDQACIEIIFSSWEVISEFVSKDNFFKTYNLILIEKHIQTIVQKIFHGSADKNGKTGAGKVNGKQLHQAFDEFYKNRGSPGSRAEP